MPRDLRAIFEPSEFSCVWRRLTTQDRLAFSLIPDDTHTHPRNHVTCPEG